MSAILTVFKKEMVDHLRDGRSILVSMIYPLMGPLLLGLMFFFVGGSMRLSDTGPLLVPVANSGSAPDSCVSSRRRGHGSSRSGATRGTWWRVAGWRSL